MQLILALGAASSRLYVLDTRKILASLFVLYGLIAVAITAFVVPPFQHPEEVNHLMRASQLAGGHLMGLRFLDQKPGQQTRLTAGGMVDPAIASAARPFVPLIFHPEIRVTRAMWAPQAHWSNSTELHAFPNTVVYPPFFYAPAALAILAGRATRMTIVQTLITARILTGLAAILIGAVAIALAETAAVWIFTVLLLPMSMDIMASLSQDGLMVACSALAGALLLRTLQNTSHRRNTAFVTLTVLLGLVAMARPPYIVLAALPLAARTIPWRKRLLAAAVSAAGVIAWSALTGAMDLTNIGVTFGADPQAQMAIFYAHPLAFAPVLWRTLCGGWFGLLQQAIGYLGWEDTALPPAYYACAIAALGVAAIGSITSPLPNAAQPVSTPARTLILAALLLASLGIFASLYVIWTRPGFPWVGGVEGRYFLPLALIGAALFAPEQTTRASARRQWHKLCVMAAAIFPIATLGVMANTFVFRYYLN